MEEIKIKESTIDQPLGFFEYYFLDNGFFELYDDFFYYKDEQGISQRYTVKRDDYGDEYIEVHVNVDSVISEDDWIDDDGNLRIYFEDKLTLAEQQKLSKDFITKKVTSFNTEPGKIKPFLDFILSQLVYLLSEVKRSRFLNTYTFHKEVLYTIIDFLFHRYNAFLPTENPIFLEAERFLLNKEKEIANMMGVTNIDNLNINDFLDLEKRTKKSGKSITSFKWKSNSETNTDLLFKILSDSHIILQDSDTKMKFEMAFSGEGLKSPLGIKWFLEKDTFIKPTLIRILKFTLMDELQVIEKMDNGSLARTLTQIFVDKDGHDIKYIINSIDADISKKSSILEVDLIASLRQNFTPKMTI